LEFAEKFAALKGIFRCQEALLKILDFLRHVASREK
jgi:hypothetical protein